MAFSYRQRWSSLATTFPANLPLSGESRRIPRGTRAPLVNRSPLTLGSNPISDHFAQRNCLVMLLVAGAIHQGNRPVLDKFDELLEGLRIFDKLGPIALPEL